jgi:TATA-binding protein-associated factor
MPTDSKTLQVPEYPTFSVNELIMQGKLLLASSGKEFVKPAVLSSPAEVKKARKEAMGRLGLEFLDDVAEEMDLDKELGADLEGNGDVDMDQVKSEVPPSPMDVCPPKKEPESGPTSRSATPADPPPPSTPSEPEQQDLTSMSARERNRLKRKRKPGNNAFVAAPPPQSAGAKYSASATANNK